MSCYLLEQQTQNMFHEMGFSHLQEIYLKVIVNNYEILMV